MGTEEKKGMRVNEERKADTIPAVAPSTAQEGVKMQTDVIAIGGNSITIQIQWPTEITQDAYDDLVDYLNLLQKRAKRAIKATSAVGADKQESL